MSISIIQIKNVEKKTDLENYLERVFEAYGIDFKPTAEKRGYFIAPGPETVVEAFPGLPDDGLAATFSRSQALIREDLAFLTWEHPLVTGAMDMILSGNTGTSIAEWKTAPQAGILLNLVYILEPILSREFDIFKFLSPTPVRLLIDHNGKFRSDLEESLDSSIMKQGAMTWPRELAVFRKDYLPDLLEKANAEALSLSSKIKTISLKSAREKLTKEYEYYAYLGNQDHSNSALCKKMADYIKKQAKEVELRIKDAGLRLDTASIVLMTQNPAPS